MNTIRLTIESLYDGKQEMSHDEFQELFNEFLTKLNSGSLQATEKKNGKWIVNHWVKKGILLGFRYGKLQNYSDNGIFPYFDKDTIPLKPVGINDNIRIVMGGTSIRSGCYIAPGVVIMPPAYINIGAFVDFGTMIDSHALVGSCARIGKRVHLSAGAMIGGVLEPVGSLPVIIENDVHIGGNCGVYEGVIVKSGAVLGAGTIITSSMPVFDSVNRQVLRAEAGNPLIIPENAVVVPGSRPLLKSDFSRENGLQIYCPVIIKYRNEKTDIATMHEDWLH